MYHTIFKLYAAGILFTLVLATSGLNGQNVTGDRVYTQVDHMPQIAPCSASNGNMYKMDRCTSTGLKAWFLANMDYPSAALKAKSEDKFGFIAIIDTFGKLSDMRPVKEMNGECAMEAHRLIQLLLETQDPWIPGMQGRKKVKVQMEICVEFNIADWNNELIRRAKELAKQDSILKASPKLDSIPKKGK